MVERFAPTFRLYAEHVFPATFCAEVMPNSRLREVRRQAIALFVLGATPIA